MKGSKRMAELLVETGAYRDLEQPVILTSGELGIYYINTEKLVQDNGEFEKYGDDAEQMYKHALRMMEQHPTFKEAIEIIAKKVEEVYHTYELITSISGGQRRDWLFSGPVGFVLGEKKLELGLIPNVFLYKQEKGIDRAEIMIDSALLMPKTFDLHGYDFIHIADLLTEGSSVYNIKDGKESGWVPMIRQRGGNIKDLFTVVTRNQGGEQRLAEQGITTHSFVSIDEAFLREHSKNPERAVAYIKNPRQWSENYLKEFGASNFMDDFNPAGPKFERAKNFLARYETVLQEHNKMNEFVLMFKERYPYSFEDTFGGKK